MTEILQNNEKLPNHSPATLQNGSGSTHEAYSSASSKKYTLTGLLKSIESEVSSLISSKRQSWVDGDRREGVQIEKLCKIEVEVGHLKNIIMSNINEIFMNLYPCLSEIKADHLTNLTRDSHTNRKESVHDRSVTVADFQVDSGKQDIGTVNNLSVNKENMSYHSYIYASDKIEASVPMSEENERDKVDRMREMTFITPFVLIPTEKTAQMRIEDGEELADLVCYEDDETLRDRRRGMRNEADLNMQKDNTFSPIEQKPQREEESVQKTLQKDNLMNYSFNPSRQLYQTRAEMQGKIQGKASFVYNGRVNMKRTSNKKYKYLDYLNQ